jgi:hypothetical protein
LRRWCLTSHPWRRRRRLLGCFDQRLCLAFGHRGGRRSLDNLDDFGNRCRNRRRRLLFDRRELLDFWRRDATTTTNPAAGRRCFRGRGRRRGLDRRSAAAPGRSRRGFLLAMPFLTLPTHADARHLVIRERTQVTANRNIHLPEEVHDLLGRDAEFPCQVVNAQLAQPILRRPF